VGGVSSQSTTPQGTQSVEDGREKEKSPTKDDAPKQNIVLRFYNTTKTIILSSWINILLVFVPIGIVAEAAHLNPSIVFTMNAIAIVPLAGLLSYATESVAKRMGDTIGALMNVTFGNAVELIIFIIALVKKEIRIVQASLLGSILANLLLILGMCLFIGGMRFREQIYNSTVTQMSACLLSLSVMSLLLPTAFHASFTSAAAADRAVVKVSRGTSVVSIPPHVRRVLLTT
jgi:Ca2+:H+ antiporter